MSNKVTDRATVYVRFFCHFSLAGAWYPLPVLVTFFTPVKEADRLTFEGDGGGGYGRLQNSTYFCVFKYARAVKQKVWNEAENRERDLGRDAKNTEG